MMLWCWEGEGWVPTVGGLLCSLSRGPGAGASTQYSRDCRLGNRAHPPPHRHNSRYTVYSENSAEGLQRKKM